MKKTLASIIVITAIGIIITTISFNTTMPIPNAVLINDAVMTVLENPEESIMFLTTQLDYAFMEMDNARQARDNRLQTTLYYFIGMFFIVSTTIALYYHNTILKPFNKLQNFAKSVAAGNLDTPLEMDKRNRFGAFTESFDIMREELRKANNDKKELVASLSHDIKTPIASIKAVTELMLLTTTNEKEVARLHTITTKAEQVNTLITNMFHSTLEELQVLNVTPVDVASTEVTKIITDADYQRRATVSQIPTCLIVADVLRLQQVFDNVISNSYKYANTSINISAKFDDDFLVIKVQDFGTGVSYEELPRLFDKFYRGGNKDKASGQGLGLFISKYFMTKMHGDIKCISTKDGFVVMVYIKMA